MNRRGKTVGAVGTNASPFKAKKSIKPAAVKARVVAMNNAGISGRQISKRTGLALNTVQKIIKIEEIENGPEYMAQVQKESISIARDAIRILADNMLDDGWLAFKYLDRVGGFPDAKQQKLQVELSKAPASNGVELTAAETKELMIKEWMAKLASVAYERSKVYESPLPELEPPFTVELELEEKKKGKH